MNAEDLIVLTALTIRTRELVSRLFAVASLAGDSAAATQLRADLEEAGEAAGTLAWRVQDREARSWGRSDHPQRHAARPRLRTQPIPLSTEVEHGIHVQRITMAGASTSEVTDRRPTTSGVWRQGQLGKPRRARE